jgi:alkanesulfonate monooxygenase SsuD/methylene tetrahydromethanopterin reductase-like flavin-dependent oxidoreductase (luciferase family)
MDFGLFMNGFRSHTTAAQTYTEDLRELILADELGFRDAWISEHHGEPIYINKVDILPFPDLLMCKAAGLTKQIRMGPAVRVLHLMHPVDVATQAAVTDNVTGGRYMFGYGSGFPTPLFSEERGLSYEDRYGRIAESLEFILKAWTTDEPFDWDGTYWRGRNVTVLPKPLQKPHPPIGVATLTPASIAQAGERGHILLMAQFERADKVKEKTDIYKAAALRAGRQDPLLNVSPARLVYIAGSVKEAINDLEPAVSLELSYQKARGQLQFVLKEYDLPKPVVDLTLEDLVDLDVYVIGDVDTVTEKLCRFWDESGGFGTMLIVCGKDWATREKRHRSMRLFMEQVAPQLRDLTPAKVAATAR